ncbi:YdgA family protein [Actinobacillus vicugnae]|uniref:YdgA family protein n=1 Tax=Actinobacillus vicugnae TaxID=2573093 RepID=UPI001242CD0D|nr:YdgA family protein [Actinobacillus vicugnae]
MKKSTIALSVVAVLAAITTGGAYYTGNQIEQRYPELIAKANTGLKVLNAYDVNAQIEEIKLTKGLFSSDVEYDLKVQTKEQTFTLKGHDKLYHGPLPLNRLIKGNLAPMLLSAETQISTLDEKVKAYFTDSNVLSATTHTSYRGDVLGNVTINPFKSKTIEASKIYFEGDYTGLGKQKLQTDSLKLQNGNETIALTGLNYQANYQTNQNYPAIKGLGDYQFALKKLTITSENCPIFNLNELRSKGNSNIANDRVLSSTDLTFKMDGNNGSANAKLGQMHFDMQADLDAKSFNEFMVLSENFDEKNPEFEQQLHTALTRLLTQSAQLKVKELSLENSKGKNRFALNLDLNKFDIAQVSQLSSVEQVLKIFKPSSLNLDLNLATTEEFIAKWLTIVPDQNYLGNPEENAKRIVQQLASIAKQSQLASVDAENVKLALNIENGKVNLNGRTLSESELQMILWALVLSISGLVR